MSGSIFTTLSVRELRATPTEPGPIQRLEIGAIDLRYSLIDLIRDGLPSFLEEVIVRNVRLELTPAEPLPPEKQQEPQAVKFPALIPERLELDQINVTIHGPDGDTVLDGLHFSLWPDRPGALKIGTLDIPGVRRWTDIAAATTFHDRSLVLSDLFIDEDIAVRELNLDMSRLEESRLGVGLNGTLFDAPVRLEAEIFDLNASNRINLKAGVEGLDFDAVWKYLNLPPPLRGRLDTLAMEFRGVPDHPRGWQGALTAGLSGLVVAEKDLGAATLSVRAENGSAVVALVDRFDERNSVSVEARIALPERLDGFPRATANGRIELKAPEAERLTFFMPEVVIGDMAAAIDFSMEDGRLKVKGAIDSGELSASQGEVTGVRFDLLAEKDLVVPEKAPFFEGLTFELKGGAATIRSSGYEAGNLQVAIRGEGPEITVEDLALSKEANQVRASGRYRLPADLQSWKAQPGGARVAVHAPDLSAFVAPASGVELSGSMEIEGQGQWDNQKASGEVAVTGRSVTFNGLTVRSVDAAATLSEARADLREVSVVLDDANRLEGRGSISWGDSAAYDGRLEARFEDLGVFRPVLPPDVPPLGGSLSVSWQGNGALGGTSHAGAIDLKLTGGQYGDLDQLSASLGGSYDQSMINFPWVTAAAGARGQVEFSLFWSENRLRITHLNIRQGGQNLLGGRIEAPLHLDRLSDPNALVPSGEPLDIAVSGTAIDLAAVARQLGANPPPVTGRASLALTASGTIDDLVARLQARITGLQSTQADDIAPADIALDLDLGKDDRLRIDGSVKQRLIQPLAISGILPFDVAAMKERRAFDPETPVDLTVTLPRSGLDFVPSLVPAIRSSRGTVAADVRVRGTVGRPDLAGSVTVDLSALRFVDPSLPPVNAFNLQLDFSGDRVRLTQCRGVVAGGNFLASGSIGFQRLDDPILDLRIGARNVLALQNDDMSVRLSSDLRMTGPLTSALAQGTVWVTRSRFFRNIDILPIGLPGRPAPQPPPEPVVVRFPAPPLRDWKFDITVKTLDPFLVQSNLAAGRITMDLHLTGTGLDPVLEGTVNVEDLTASLPFSRLQIRDGQVFFTRQQPFVPQLNLRGTSVIRDYNVTVFLSGTAYDPQALFTSDPPLPQAEVVSLLATGMTTQEIARDPNALAGRAAVLLFQRIYNSVFRRNKPPVEQDAFLSRIRFDIGITDPKTGRQSTTIGIPLSENVVLMGGVDVGGNFQGQVKYLIRFK